MQVNQGRILYLGEVYHESVFRSARAVEFNSINYVENPKLKIGGASINLALITAGLPWPCSLYSYFTNEIVALLPTIPTQSLNISQFRKVDGTISHQYTYLAHDIRLSFYQDGSVINDMFRYDHLYDWIQQHPIICFTGGYDIAFRHIYLDFVSKHDFRDGILLFYPGNSVKQFKKQELELILNKTSILVLTNDQYKDLLGQLSLNLSRWQLDQGAKNFLSRGVKLVALLSLEHGSTIISDNAEITVNPVVMTNMDNFDHIYDILLTGLIYGLIQYNNPQYALEYGYNLAQLYVNNPIEFLSLQHSSRLSKP